MKTKFKGLLLTIFFSCMLQNSNAQFINSLSVYPTNPTSNDSIFLVASCYFQSGSCNQKTLAFNIQNDIIDCGAMHCLGMAAYICYDTDTFSIGKLAPGNYQFKYTVNAGLGSVPCTPGFVPGPTDSLSFVVTQNTFINELTDKSYSILPNPCHDILYIKNIYSSEVKTSIYDLKGRVIEIQNINSDSNKIDVSHLENGLYLIKFQSPLTGITTKLFYKD